VRQPLGDLVVANGAIEHQDIPGNIITLADGEGNVTPKYEIKCPDFSPWGIATDAESNIWTTDYDKDEVRAYPSNASGCPAPLVTLKGPHTQIDIPEDVLIDHQGRIIVINYLTSILVFAPDANGDATPLQVIQGPHTHIAHFEGAAIGPDNHIYATSYPNAEVVEYAPAANGDAAPLRIISGNKTGLDAPIGIALDKKGNIYVANFGGHDTVVFAAKAHGNVKPLKVLAPPQNGDLWSPTGVFVR
jgi:hypothetical protein